MKPEDCHVIQDIISHIITQRNELLLTGYIETAFFAPHTGYSLHPHKIWLIQVSLEQQSSVDLKYRGKNPHLLNIFILWSLLCKRAGREKKADGNALKYKYFLKRKGLT